MKIFGMKLIDYFKPTWMGLLAVALIGQFQILNELFLHIQILEMLPLGFLHFTQLVWTIIIALTIWHIVKKMNFTFIQASFVGFLYIIAFGVLKIITRIALGHDIQYLFFGDLQRLSPLLEAILFISILTIITATAAQWDKKIQAKKK